jgi:hypothetical protein
MIRPHDRHHADVKLRQNLTMNRIGRFHTMDQIRSLSLQTHPQALQQNFHIAPVCLGTTKLCGYSFLELYLFHTLFSAGSVHKYSSSFSGHGSSVSRTGLMFKVAS